MLFPEAFIYTYKLEQLIKRFAGLKELMNDIVCERASPIIFEIERQIESVATGLSNELSASKEEGLRVNMRQVELKLWHCRV